MSPRRSARRTWAWLVEVTARREPGMALALMRIGIGATVLLTLMSIVVHGLVDVLLVDEAHGGYWPLTPTWPVVLLGGPTRTTAWLLLGGGIASSACLMLGLGGRLAAGATLFAYMGATRLHLAAGGSYDALVDNALWLLVLADSTATLSLPCRLRTGRWVSDALVPAWPRWLAVYQLMLVYLSSGLSKVSAHWVPGGDSSALFYILQWPAWRRFDPCWLADAYPLTQVATVVVWCFEVTVPLWLLARWWHATRDRPGRLRAWSNRLRLRWWYFGVGVGMHLATWLLLEVGPFSPAILSMYACMLAPDDLMRRRRE